MLNYRIVSLGATTLALLVIGESAFAAEKATDKSHAAMLLRCAAVCADCQVQCDACFHHCASLVSDGAPEHAKCMHLCVDCSECCTLCAKLCARESRLSLRAADFCAQCCDECAVACEEFPDDKHMIACSKACRNCAQECRDMVKKLK